MLLGRKTSTRRGVIGTSCPVLGLRPTRCPFLRMLKELNEESLTAWPSARLSDNTLTPSSTSSWHSLRCSPTFWTTVSARSARVSVLPLMLLAPPLLSARWDANHRVFLGQLKQLKLHI